jgi:hypothetical protein
MELSMHKALFLAIALALSASSAHAQGRDWNRDDDDDWGRRSEYRDERGRERDDDGWREERRGRFSGRRVRGARFVVRSGETRLAVVCDPGETMRNCVDAALTLLDRAKQAGSTGSAPTSASPTPSTRP